MKFYVSQNIAKDIQWSKEIHPNGDAKTLSQDLKFQRMAQLGELGEQHLKPIKREGNIIIYTGEAPVKMYKDLINFNYHNIIGDYNNPNNNFDKFVPKPSIAFLVREFTFYKKLANFTKLDPKTKDQLLQNAPNLHKALQKYSYFSSGPTHKFNSIGEAMVTYFVQSIRYTQSLSPTKIANLPSHQLLFNEILSALPLQLN